MVNLKNKKFIASYSGGKDSALALYRALCQNMKPIELFTTYNADKNQTWFHGLSENLLSKISNELGIPITLLKTSGKKYEENFEIYLKNAKKMGAEVCVFGDIDIEEHIKWCTDRCLAAGMTAYFPLWQESRKSLVHEFIETGFKTIITIIDTSKLSENFAGKILTKQLAAEIELSNADICGENGEYHTFAFDGPIFKNPVKYKLHEKIKHDKYIIIPIS